MSKKKQQRIDELTTSVLARLNGMGIDLANREACEADLAQTVCAELCLMIYREHIYKGANRDAIQN